MKMEQLKPADLITTKDYIKLRSSTKAVIVCHCAGFRVNQIVPYMDPDFEGFFREKI